MNATTISVELAARVDAHEGSVYVAEEHALYFTTLPRPGADVAIKRLALDDGTVSILVPAANRANGMTLAPDGRHLAGGRPFAVVTPGFPDGIKVDVEGRVYVSSSSGVQIFSPEGDRIGEIPLRGPVNFAWAGNVLYITTDDAVWSAAIDTKGA